MAKANFKAKLLLAGKTATGFEVPTKAVEALGTSKRPAVKVTINGYTYRSTVAVMGGKFMVGVNAGHRDASGVKAGDTLNVTLELDTEKRTVDAPAELKKVFAKDKAVKAKWESLSFTSKREIAEAIAAAKKPETRERRIAKALAELRS